MITISWSNLFRLSLKRINCWILYYEIRE
jgi:hypothetical protein